MFKYVHYAVGGLIVLPFAFGAGYVVGVKQHKAAIESKMKDDRIEILKDGKNIDEKVMEADDVGLCAVLGGC